MSTEVTKDPSRQSLEESTRSVARYNADGFVHARGVLARAEVDVFLRAVGDAVAARTRNDGRPLAARSPYEQSARQCISIWEDFPEVRPVTFHPKIVALAAQLLETNTVRLWHDQALFKEAGGRETEAHQDYAYWPVAEPDLVTAWIPLVDVGEESGCMGYVPGTQASPREFVDIFRTPGAGKAYESRHTPAVFVPARAGDVIFHAARTVHMAKANRSSHTRAVHTVVYFRDGCTRSDVGADLPADRNGTKPGEPIVGPATPIVWPMVEGRYPPPPPPLAPEAFGDAYRGFVKIGLVPTARLES